MPSEESLATSPAEKPASRTALDWAVLLAFLLLGLWAADYWVRTIVTVRHNYLPTPIWDYWDTAIHLDDYRRFNFRILWILHNEHRIIFPEVAFAADYMLFQGREIFPLVLNIGFHVATSVIFLWALFRTANLPRKVAIAEALLAAVFLGWPGLTFLLSGPFDLQWTMLEFFSAMAFWGIAMVPRSKFRFPFLSTAIFCAAIATFTSANGLALWPILFAAALWLRLRIREMLALVVAGSVFTGLYFVGYHPEHPTHPSVVLPHLVYWMQYLGCYLGTPFSYINTSFGIAMGWLSALIFVALVWRLRRDDVRGEPAAVIFMGFILIALATAILTSFGRMNPNDVGFIMVRQGRYILLPVLYWISLFMTSVWLIGLGRRGPLRATLLLCGFAAFMAVTLPKAEAWTINFNDDYARFQLASLSLEVGLEDHSMIRSTVFPIYEWPHILLPKLRSDRLALFADSRFSWMFRYFQSPAIAKETNPIPGGIFVKKPVEGGWEVQGWVTSESPAHEFVLVDEAGFVVGLGECPDAGLPGGDQFPIPEHMRAWEGFVNGQRHSKSVRAWAFNADRTKFSPVGQTIPLN